MDDPNRRVPCHPVPGVSTLRSASKGSQRTARVAQKGLGDERHMCPAATAPQSKPTPFGLNGSPQGVLSQCQGEKPCQSLRPHQPQPWAQMAPLGACSPAVVRGAREAWDQPQGSPRGVQTAWHRALALARGERQGTQGQLHRTAGARACASGPGQRRQRAPGRWASGARGTLQCRVPVLAVPGCQGRLSSRPRPSHWRERGPSYQQNSKPARYRARSSRFEATLEQ